MAKRADVTKSRSHEVTKAGTSVPSGSGPDAAESVVLPWEAEPDTPMEGEVRTEMLARIADALPESERPAYLAYVEANAGENAGPGAPVSYTLAAGSLLGEFMVGRLVTLGARVNELEAEKKVTESRSHEVTKSDAGVAGGSVDGGSVADLVLAAVRERCAAALALPCITGEMADANPAAGLDEMTADELVALIESIGDPVGDVAAIKAPVHKVADELRALTVDPVRLVNEASDNVRRHHEHAYRYWLRRKTLAEAALAKREAVAQ